MTYSLPFGLKVKPASHPLENGQIRFKVRDGDIHYEIKIINKSYNYTAFVGIVRDKAELDYLTTVKKLPIDSTKLIDVKHALEIVA